MKTRPLFRFLITVAALLLLSAFLNAQVLTNNEVEFSGSVASVASNGEGGGTVFVHVDTIDLRVIVNPSSLLKNSDGEPITMDELAALTNPAVEVTGKFSSSGVLATTLRVLKSAAAPNTFEIRGHITNIQSSGGATQLSLLGLTVVVASGTAIKQDGADVPVSALQIGTDVEITGHIDAQNTWIADSITLEKAGKKNGKLTFEGTVESYDQQTHVLQVAVSGATGNITSVFITPDTVVTGDLVKGAYVVVIGMLKDFSVTAKEVRVVGPFEIKPDERKLKIGDTGVFTVKLREVATAAVTVTLSVKPAGIVSLQETSVTVPKDSQTADFSVKAEQVGTATIEAMALNSSATALVMVGNVSEEENERPAGQVRVAFAPDHIKIAPNDMRDVVVLIQPPQQSAVDLTFTPGKLVEIIGQRSLGNGAASLKLTIESGPGTGTDSIKVTLPQALGGGTAELLVEVQAKKN